MPVERHNARNNARCMQARKTTHGLDRQHQYVDRTHFTLKNRTELVTFQQIPDIRKCANISPIYKKGRKDEVNNYRPVSLTCILCKILESIIRDKVKEHFISNKLFTNRQFGFLKGRSTVTQLLQILDDWTEASESGGRIDVIYTNFE